MEDELLPFKRAAEVGCARFRTHFSDGDPVNFPPEYLAESGEWYPLLGIQRAKGRAYQKFPG